MEGCAATNGAYNVSENVTYLFIIMVVSTLGTMVPIIATSHGTCRQLPLMMLFLFNFGTGVVLATAFVHMIPPANDKLTNPCLGPIVDEYGALAFVFTLVSLFAMHLLDFVFERKDHVKLDALPVVQPPPPPPSTPASRAAVAATPTRELRVEDFIGGHQRIHATTGGHDGPASSIMAFEAGVTLHSLVIGLSLGVLSGNEAKTLLIALCFHQFFEGFALAATIVLGKGMTFKQICKALFPFWVATPAGVLVGILIHGSYNENSKTALWTEGTLEALSAGALIYTGIVEFMTHGLTNNPVFSRSDVTTRYLIAAFAGLYTGAGAMAVVGKWA